MAEQGALAAYTHRKDEQVTTPSSRARARKRDFVSSPGEPPGRCMAEERANAAVTQLKDGGVIARTGWTMRRSVPTLRCMRISSQRFYWTGRTPTRLRMKEYLSMKPCKRRERGLGRVGEIWGDGGHLDAAEPRRPVKARKATDQHNISERTQYENRYLGMHKYEGFETEKHTFCSTNILRFHGRYMSIREARDMA
jgi:hypothetical protein